MSCAKSIEALRSTGTEMIKRDGAHEHSLIPLQQTQVVFRQIFEYPVNDFPAEVGFYARVFGFGMEALTEDYALFKHPQHEYCISFRKSENDPLPSSINLKLLLMTTDIPGADAHLEQTGFVPDREIREVSPVQRVIHFNTPSGLATEIWEMPTDE